MYPDHQGGFDIEDRALAHLRVVVMNKLRRAEPFMLSLPSSDGLGSRSIWVHPSVPMVFHFFGGRLPSLDRELVEQMMKDASSPDGLILDLRSLA